MGKVISVIQQSGGIGKSTSVFNISHILADKSKKVLALDNDIQSDLMPFFLGRDDDLKTVIPDDILSLHDNSIVIGEANTVNLYLENKSIKPFQIKDNLYYIGATKQLTSILNMEYDEIVYNFMNNIQNLKDQFDYILIDCPPTESNLQKCALMGSDYILIPTHIEPKSIGGIDGTLSLYNRMKKIKSRQKDFNTLDILGIFISQYSPNNLMLENIYKDKIKELYGEFLLDSQISNSIRIKESTAASLSIVDYSKVNKTKGSVKAASEYTLLVEELITKMEGL